MNRRLCKRSLSSPNGSCMTDDANIQNPPNSPACASVSSRRDARIGWIVGRVEEKQSTVKWVNSRSRNASRVLSADLAGRAAAGAGSPEYVPPSSVATGLCLITAFACRSRERRESHATGAGLRAT